MNAARHDQNWETRLRAGLGSPPAPDFAAWSEQNAEALAALGAAVLPAPTQGPPTRNDRTGIDRRTLLRSAKWAVASLLVVGGLAWISSGGKDLSPSAFADEIPGVDNVQSMTWTDTYYIRVTSEDGKRTWIQKERRLHAYRHPGIYRETMLNDNGEVISVHITDRRAGRMLRLDVKGKKGTLMVPPFGRGEGGPFAWVGDLIRERKFGDASTRVKSLSLAGQKEIDKVRANVVRARIQSENQTTRLDFMFDVSSKRLAGMWAPNPGNDDFDPDALSDRDYAAEKTWSKMQPIAALTHEIVLNPKLDPSEFSLDAPAGYTVEKIAKPTVTEEEMIAWLGAAARFNDNSFPDSPYDAFDREKFNAASAKAESERTAVEQELIALRDKIMLREIYRSPVMQFEEDHTVPKSFHYVGSGVKVGEADRLVGWYKLRNPSRYRAVYGDLSVKDVKETDLPLSLGN